MKLEDVQADLNFNNLDVETHIIVQLFLASVTQHVKFGFCHREIYFYTGSVGSMY